MTKKRFKRVTICLTEEEHTILKKLSHISEKTLSDLIRDQFPVLVKMRHRESLSIAKPS